MDDEPDRFALIAYLEEALPADEMARVETRLRDSTAWRDALLALRDEVEPGEHSVATIWRRHRLTCAPREQLGLYLLGGLLPEEEDFLRFHLEVIQCRFCQANLEDLRAVAQSHRVAESSAGRRRFFESSVGFLPPKRST